VSYQRLKGVEFGSSRSGLSTVAYSLDGGGTWSTAGVAESPAGSGIYSATITFPDGFTGTLTWKTGEVSGQRFASEVINPGADENSDAKSSSVPAGVWSNGSRTLSAFNFGVSVSGPVQIDTDQPIPIRNQDSVTAPTIGDAFLGAWAEPFAKEATNAATKTYTKKLPDNSGPVRTYNLTVDVNGNVTAR